MAAIASPLTATVRAQTKVGSRSAIAPGRAALAQQKAPIRSRAKFGVSANLQLAYHLFDEEWVVECGGEFPEKGIADHEEAMCLLGHHGYTILDIRAKSEIEAIGNYPREMPIHVKTVVNVPLINATRKYNTQTQQKEYVQESNVDFIAQVSKVFAKDAKIIISCSDGRNRAIQALEALDEAGFTNIVGLKGGYNLWNRSWDSKLRFRDLPGMFKEEFQHKADGCGVHATGAGFENQDAFQRPDIKDQTEWIEWSGNSAPAGYGAAPAPAAAAAPAASSGFSWDAPAAAEPAPSSSANSQSGGYTW